MPKRGSPSGPSLAQQALVHSAAIPSRTSSAPSPPQTASAASSVQPPAKTASRRKSVCSSGVEQVVAPGDRVAQRPLPRRQVARAPGQQRQRCVPAVPAAPAAARALTRAAASSMASGSPSSRRQIAATAGGVLLREREVGLDGLRPLRRTGAPPRTGRARSAAGAARVGQRQRRHGNSRSPAAAAAPGWWPAPSAAGRPRADRPRRGAASSDLLEVVEHQQQPLRSRRNAVERVRSSGCPPASRTPRRCAIAGRTRAGSVSGRGRRTQTPSGKRRAPPRRRPAPAGSCRCRRGRSGSRGGRPRARSSPRLSRSLLRGRPGS